MNRFGLMSSFCFAAGLGCHGIVNTPLGGGETGIGSGGNDPGGNGSGGAGPGNETGGNTATSCSGSGTTGGIGTFPAPGVTTQGIFIPNAHPRLFWTPSRLATAKAWWAKHKFEPRADEYSVLDQLFAYMMTGTAKYCTQAIGHTMAVDLSSCPASKAGCDGARWYGETAIATYDWCFSVLTDAQKTTFRTNWNTWLNNIRAQAWGGVGHSQSNYYWGNVRNNILWGIASYQENQAAAEAFLTDGLVTRYQKDFIPASTREGEASGGLGLEGGQYGPYQSYYVSSLAFPSLAASGRDAWTETSYWKGTVLNRVYMTPPQPTKTQSGLRGGWDTFAFGDDEGWENGSPAADTEKGTFMMAAANRWADSNIGKWARQWLQTVAPTIDAATASTDLCGPALDYGTLPLDYYNAGPRYLVGRSAWNSNATAYLWQMGDHYSDGHNHDDWGAFQIHRKGRWLSRETVGYSETVPAFGGTGSQPLYTGFAHNIPLVNGMPGVIVQGFPPSAKYDGNWDASPVVRRLESRNEYSFADVDLTGVYHCCPDGPGQGNNAAVHVEREYWFLRDIETFVIFDRLQSDTAARSKSFLIHCETNPTLVDATHLNCVNGDQQLAITTLLPAKPSSRTVVDESKGSTPAPKANVQFRVEINDMPNATSSYTLHVLQAMDASGTRLNPTVVDSMPGQATAGTFAVTLDSKHSLIINKGMSSAGGSISINGTTQDLRTNVQPFALDSSDMPVWSP